MKEAGKMIKLMVMGYIVILMELNMRETGKKIDSTGKD